MQVPVTGFNLQDEQRQRKMSWPHIGKAWNDNSNGLEKKLDAKFWRWRDWWEGQPRWERQSEEGSKDSHCLWRAQEGWKESSSGGNLSKRQREAYHTGPNTTTRKLPRRGIGALGQSWQHDELAEVNSVLGIMTLQHLPETFSGQSSTG